MSKFRPRWVVLYIWFDENHDTGRLVEMKAYAQDLAMPVFTDKNIRGSGPAYVGMNCIYVWVETLRKLELLYVRTWLEMAKFEDERSPFRWARDIADTQEIKPADGED